MGKKENKIQSEEELKLMENPPLYWTKKEPRKSLSTYLRNQNKFILSSLAIADRKAMIMIRVNSTLVSAIIVFYQYINENIVHGSLMAVVLVLGSGGALIVSVLSARPNGLWFFRFFKKNIEPKYPDLEYNNFMVRGHTTLDEYEISMDKVARSQELQIGNQTRFAYALENYLSSKYRLLDIAYNLFIVTFLLISIIFIVGVLF